MKKNKIVLAALPILATLLLVSCWSNTNTDSWNNWQNIQSQQQGWPWTPGWRWMGRYWSWSQRSGSGSQRFWSWAMNAILNSLSTEDKAIFKQMQDARKSWNTTLANQLKAQLQAKYPNLKFGNGWRGRNGSGSINTGSINTPPASPATVQ